MNINEEKIWTIVQGKRKKEDINDYIQENKIDDPCWFYNNGGCRNKDGTEKAEENCKYTHIMSSTIKRPPHLIVKKPCDRFNLEGLCIWKDICKYSHRNLSPDEWNRYYPTVPFQMKLNIKKRMLLEKALNDIDSQIKVFEFKIEGICNDVQNLSELFKEILDEIKD